MAAPDLLARLRRAREDHRLRAVDVALAEWCLRHGGSQPVALGMALVSQALGDGHSCLPLEGLAPAVPGEHPLCDAPAFQQALADSPLVGEPGEPLPLIRDGQRLYLQRYWQYEVRLAERLRAMVEQPPSPVDPAPLGPDGGLFDYAWVDEGETHWQAVAAAAALRHRFTVISGGPGTGKTYTVLRLMDRLVRQAQERGEKPPVIRLAAPTGKAAARMMESTRQGLAGLADGETLRPHLPGEAATLHRLLGLRGEGTRPRHDRDQPLAADVVIVDEASMVDLPLMAKLTDAVPDHGRLILLGDRYQLASVESGAVLAELCDAAGTNDFSPDQHRALFPLLPGTPAATADAAEHPLADHVVTLQTGHRFTPDSPIGQLAEAVNAGDAPAARAIVESGREGLHAGPDRPVDREVLTEILADAYAPLMAATDPEAALAALDRVRLLTPTRVGPEGSVAFNERIHRRLAELHGLDPEARWYHGRPIIVRQNDYRVGLFNGDTGVCLIDSDGTPRVHFRTPDGLRALLPTALPEHETVYAMTVHKSQGSEFEQVHLLLPAQAENPVLTRELVYTGITRARSHLSLHGPLAALERALARRTQRASGLGERLGHRD
ncbi:exodeoxyribonuclease V subunit alpha [Thiohalospira sp.]|uniref:exodeoxyribonuclease V subunit alpha n=1 Tax=Thiohalospira sp. TaxID=3080549 RepID=UPI00397FB58E